jgi:hypothetical protein
MEDPGDLRGLAEHLPPDLTVEELAGKSTGQLAGRLRRAVGKVNKPPSRRTSREASAF